MLGAGGVVAAFPPPVSAPVQRKPIGSLSGNFQPSSALLGTISIGHFLRESVNSLRVSGGQRGLQNLHLRFKSGRRLQTSLREGGVR